MALQIELKGNLTVYNVNTTKRITAMSNEESHYWFAKISNGKRSQALRAIRVLLGE
ncbi:MAG: hypothetical protein PUP93_27375 [Rhizonema sp. NSF051]|nr:hypothetical protein [Rhizonema sp. NSF051]